MAIQPKSSFSYIRRRSSALGRRINLLKHVSATRFSINRTIAENIMDEDIRKPKDDTSDRGLKPIPEPAIKYGVIDDTDSEFSSFPSGDGNRRQTLFSIPTITSLEEAGLQQYYNSFLNSTRWQVSNLNVKPGDDNFLLWFLLSSYVPLICSCTGPMSNMFSLFAIICSWKRKMVDPVYEQDPVWCYVVNSISVCLAMVSNGFLLFNYRKTVRYTYCQVISISGWFIASIMLTTLIIVYHWWFYHNHYDDEYRLGFGFWFAIITVVLHFFNFSLLALNELGFLLKKYKPVFNIDHVQSSLIIQTLCICIWVGVGAGVFTRLINLDLAESLFYCVMSIVTIGYQGIVPATKAAQAVTSVWLVIGLIFFGLTISSIRQLIIEFSKSTLQWHRLEKMRLYVYENHKKEGKGSEHEITPQKSFKLMKHAIKWAYMYQGVTELSLSVVIFMITLMCGAIGFSLFEGWKYHQSVYFCFFSLLTLGEGNVVPTTPGGIVFFSVWALSAIPVMTILVSTASDFVFSKITAYQNTEVLDLFTEFCLKHKYLKAIGQALQKQEDLSSLSIKTLMEMNDMAGVTVHTDTKDVQGEIPLSSRPLDLLLNVLMDYDKLDDLSFVNTAPFKESNTISVHLSNYTREGLVADYDEKALKKVRETVVEHLKTLDDSLDVETLKANYGIGPSEGFCKNKGNGVINKDNIIETGFRKKNDYILTMLSKIQIVIMELKRTSILMATDTDYKHSFSQWDKFLKITKNHHYKEDPLFWIEAENPMAFPTDEPSYFTLHYLRYLSLLVQEFAAEYDQIKTSVPLNERPALSSFRPFSKYDSNR